MNTTYIGDIKEWARQLNELESRHRCVPPAFLKPFHLVSLGLRLGRMGATVRLPEALTSYACRMRLWQAINRPAPLAVNEHPPGGKFQPLQTLADRSEVDGYATALAAVAGRFGADGETVRSLGISLSEIMENCFAHADATSPLVGLACAQAWPNGRRAQIAIGDDGIGIRASLSQNAELSGRLAKENSCALASELGVTGKPQMGHAGYGLALTRQLLACAGGTLLVVSHGEWFVTHGHHVSMGELSEPWAGTLVVLDWSTVAPLRASEVYSSWPLPRGYSDDDFDL